MQGATSFHPSDQTLRAFGNGQLDPIAAAAVSSHLDECEDGLVKVAGTSSDAFLDAFRKARSTPGPERRSAEGDPDWPRAVTRPSLPRTEATTLPLSDEMPVELASHPDYKILRELGRGG